MTTPAARATAQNGPKMPEKSEAKVWLYVCLGIIALAFIFHSEVGQLSVNFFVVGDNLFHLNSNIDPVFFWCIPGLLLGLICGAVVAMVKYKLAVKWLLMPIAFLIAVISILWAISGPIARAPEAAYMERIEGYDFVNVQSTSALPDYKRHSYTADNLIDRDQTTAWMFVENELEHKVRFSFSKDSVTEHNDIKVTGLRIRNGYARIYAKWKNYNRVKEIGISYNSTSLGTFLVPDEYGSSRDIDLKGFNVTKNDFIEIKIISIYPGNKPKMNITAITEMVPLITYRD